MKVLGWCAGNHDLDVVFRGEEEEPFESCAGVFGALALESVRQK
jgi:hypothetical protein